MEAPQGHGVSLKIFGVLENRNMNNTVAAIAGSFIARTGVKAARPDNIKRALS